MRAPLSTYYFLAFIEAACCCSVRIHNDKAEKEEEEMAKIEMKRDPDSRPDLDLDPIPILDPDPIQKTS